MLYLRSPTGALFDLTDIPTTPAASPPDTRPPDLPAATAPFEAAPSTPASSRARRDEPPPRTPTDQPPASQLPPPASKRLASRPTELTRLIHGDSGVGGVAFSPDGTRVATASFDNTARVLDPATGRELARMAHDEMVKAVAFSPDGTRVATASSDDTARVFDPATGRELARMALDDGGDVVNAVAFSPDGTRLATGSERRVGAGVGPGHRPGAGPLLDHGGRGRGGVQPGRHPGGHRQRDDTARVLDPATGRAGPPDHDETVNAVAFSPDGTRVATGSGDRSARVLDAAAGAELARLDHDGDCARGGVQPGWHPGGHRQRRQFGAGV